VLLRTRPTVEITISETPTEEWFRSYWSVEAARGRTDSDAAVCRDVLLAPRLPTAFATAHHGSETIGIGQLVIEQGWGGIQCMATEPDHRREGVAQAVMNALAQVADRRGIGQMYLAVLAANEAAAALYEDAGFQPTHEYRYFTNNPD
jgi:GNAT superfamily N-acetyltransferase